MKKFKLLLIFCSVLVSTSLTHAQITAKVYESQNLGQVIKTHKSIAILPLNVVMKDTRKKKNRTSQEALDKQAKDYQKTFQNSMYSWFLKRQQKSKLVDIRIQDVDKTNAILKKNGVNTSEDLADITKEEIAKLLEVDAVLGGNASTTATFSKGGAFALALLTNVSVSTGDADVFIKLWNGSDGEMIWSFDRTVKSTHAHSTDKMVDYLMKRVSKRFPYNK